jgi:hypothetical protein
MKTFNDYLEAASKKEKDPEDYKFTVWRVVKDPYDTYQYAVKGFDTEEEADKFADREESFNQDYDTKFVVREN